MAEKFEWPNINLDSSQEKVFCYGLRNQVGILVDGTVVPCCLDSEGTIELGNIFNTSFTNIIGNFLLLISLTNLFPPVFIKKSIF